MSSDLQRQLGAALGERYDVTREIGRGGMAVVFEGVDRRHSRQVAIKVLREEIAGSVGVERFLQEIQIEARLQHPHILPLLDSGRMGEVPYCVLPLVKGPSLRDRLRVEGQLPIDDAVQIARDVAGALGHAHAANVVHRDVKPENILLADGRAVLADFGIARAVTKAATDRFTSEGVVVGTPAYMSPEQAGGSGILDGRSDLYSLGLVLFEMLAGEPPFSGRTAEALIAKHRLEAPPSLRTLRPTVPEPLAQAVAKVLAKSPADRFATAELFVAAMTAPERQRLWGSPRTRIAVGLGIGILAAGTWTFWPERELDVNAVAVFPVKDASAGTGAALLSDDVAFAIEMALDHARPLKWLHGWDFLEPSVRSDPMRLDVRMQRRITRAQGARFFIDGQVRRSGTFLTVELRLHDVGSDTVVARESATAATPTDVASLGLEATRKLLVRWLAPGRTLELQPLLELAPAAIALQLQGEREYRSARFSSALELFERALREDTTFAYAAVKAAQSASWLNLLGRAETLSSIALRHQARLPAQYRPFVSGLHAYLTGRADSAVRMLTAALDVAPDWDEAHMARGEVYYHLIPRLPRLDSIATAEFSAATARDPSFTPPLTHLAEASARTGDAATLDRYLERIRSAGADPSWLRELGIMRDCLRDAGGVRWDALTQQDPTASLSAAKAFVSGLSRATCADSGAQAVLRLTGNEGHRWGGFLVRHSLYMAQGRYTEALRALDSARTTGTTAVLYLYVIGAAAEAPFATQADGVLTFAQRAYGSEYEQANLFVQDTRAASALWIAAVWHRNRGDSSMVRRIAERLRLAADSQPNNRRLALLTRAVSAHEALARLDTAEAIDRLAGLNSTARRDSLSFDHFEALAVERMLLAQILLARKAFAGALEVAATFDHPEPVVFVSFLPLSLRIRAEAADSLRMPQQAQRYRDRLQMITRTR